MTGSLFLLEILFLFTGFLFLQLQYQQHVAEMEAAKAGMPTVSVNHDTGGGSAIRDIHMDNFNVSVGGRDLIVDGSITLSFGRHYGGFDRRFYCF